MNGKKTYLTVIAGLIASVALFVQAGNYNLDSILHLVQSDAILGGIAFLRMAVAKKAV